MAVAAAVVVAAEGAAIVIGTIALAGTTGSVAADFATGMDIVGKDLLIQYSSTSVAMVFR